MVVTNEPMKELTDGRARSSLPLPGTNTNIHKVLTSNPSVIAIDRTMVPPLDGEKVAVVLNSGKVSKSQ